MTTTAAQDLAALRAELARRRLAGPAAGAAAEAPRAALPVLPAAQRALAQPLSAAQRWFWLLDQLNPGSTEYLVSLAVRLDGRLDRDAWGRAWARLVARHEPLRTRILAPDGEHAEPVQIVDPCDAPAECTVIDLSALPQQDRDARCHELARAQATRPFVLDTDWPARCALISLAADEHVAVISCHHSMVDGVTMDLLLRELCTFYVAEAAGTPSESAPPRVSYLDYASWSRSASGSADLDYWRTTLAGLPRLELPTDRPAPARRDWAGASAPLRVAPELVGRLRELAERHHTSLFAVLVAGLNTLLSRYADADDIAIGTPVANRTHPDTRQMIGCFLNTLVLRTAWSGDPTVDDAVAAAARTVADALAHQDAPYEQVVRAVAPVRDATLDPLVRALISLSPGVDEAELPGLSVSRYPLDVFSAQLDLMFSLHTLPDGGISGDLVYATSIFEDETATQLAANLLAVLEAFAADGSARLSRLVLPSPEAVSAAASLAPTADRDGSCLHTRVERHAAANPQAPAVIFGDSTLTYGELNVSANRIAHRLRAEGVGPEQLVAVCVDRSELLPTAILGTLKSGGAYLPVDPSSPAERIAFMLDDARVTVALTDRANEEGVRAVHLGSVIVLEDVIEAAVEPSTDPESLAGPDNLAYVIYTSGSTGRPKGVCVTHANVLRLFETTQADFGFDDTDVWTLFHSFAFDFSVWELWGALLYGGRLVVVPRETATNPDAFLELLADTGVTVLNQTPSAFRSLITATDGPDVTGRLRLKTVIFGGEKLEPAALAPWVKRFGLDQPRLINMYGITETTVHTTYRPLTPADVAAAGRSPIGGPLRDLRIHLLDRHGEPVARGAVGEICVGGPGVTRGYLGRPELTATRFIPDPYGPPGSRLYRSGDLARRHADGELEFLGRADGQVKIRGHRIELGEIEAALVAQPGIAAAVAQVRTDANGERLVGYLVPAPGGTVDPAALRTELQSFLPGYMVPAAFVRLDAIPMTVNGKLDVAALPAPTDEAVAAATASTYVAPRTAAEERAALVWAQVLGLSRVGVEDGFFDLGGDSVRAVALVGALRSAGFDVTVRDLFDYRTVANLCAQTGELADADKAVEPFALIDQASRDKLPAGAIDAYPMSVGQLGMVAEMLADDGARNYHNVTAMRVTDDAPFVEEAFHAAAELMVSRHEILRTGFELEAYELPLQIVYAEASMPTTAFDYRELDPDEQIRRVRGWMEDQRERMFDLAVPTLLRLSAHRTSEQDWWLGVTECHPILEGWSFHSLLMEFLRAYRALRVGAEPEPAAVGTVRYADFIALERASLASERDLAYWRAMVERYPAFRLPEAWGAPAADQDAKESVDGSAAGDAAPLPYHTGFDLAPYYEDIKALATRADASVKSVLHAVHLKVLSMITPESEFLSGLICDARPEAEGADRVYGMYLNPVPFPHDRSARTWIDLVRKTFAQELELWPHRRHPLGAIQNLAPEPGRLLQVFFNYLDFHVVDTGLVDYRHSIDLSPNEFVLRVTTQARHFTFTADTRVLSKPNVDRIAAMYRAVLERMLAEPDGDAVATVLPAGERELQLREWNTQPGPVATESALELIEARIELSPDAVAVDQGTTTLTYAQLGEQADRMAACLRALGAGRDRPVGVLLDRGPDLLVTMLAAWKVGAPYVPLDASHPGERIAYSLTDSNAAIVVTEAQHLHLVAGFAGAVLDPADAAAQPIDDTPAVYPHPADLAYLIYTSGSTGRPKGVAVTHSGLSTYLDWCVRNYFERSPGGSALFSSVAYDMVVPILFAPLVLGRTVTLLPHGLPLDQLGEKLADCAPHAFVKLTPGHLDLLSEQLLPEEAARIAGVFVVGGDELTRDAVERWRKLLVDGAGPLILNEYGPTEITVANSVHPVHELDPNRPIPIGKPIPETTMYVLDEALEPVPVGAIGEICVGGHGVARGYAGQPGLTARSFRPDPYGPAGSRLYRTGDLGRFLDDGTMEYLGRADDQVKLRGYRIEPGEIQAVLAAHPAVRAAHVAVRSGTLIAYWVPESDATADESDHADLARLTEHCAAHLPAHMVPGRFVPLERIPLNANGKVDRRALPELDPQDYRDEQVAPRTPTERRIAEIWAEVLRRPVPSVLADFFALGGDSVLSTRLVLRMQKEFEAPVTLRALFEAPTVAGLAAVVDGSFELAPPPDLPAELEAARAALTDRIPARPAAPEPLPDTTEAVLLTGVTGFLGSFLLKELLERTDADVHCLVRAQDEDKAWQRVIESSARYGLWDPARRNRIHVVPGDLGAENLGLTPRRFRELARELDAVYHAGANVHLVEPYSRVRTVNVDGTREILRLAALSGRAPVHYVSTGSVFGDAPKGFHVPVKEDIEPSDPTALREGYTQSKWVAEQLVRAAGRDGLPVTVHRSGRISGHSGTGACQTDDLLWLVIKGIVQAGIYPEGAAPSLNLVPVDHVAGGIVELARRTDTLGGVFHHANPDSMKLPELFAALVDFGYPLRPGTAKEWLDAVRADPGNAAYPLLGLFQANDGGRYAELRLGVEHTASLLAEVGLVCAAPDTALIHTYLRYFAGTGFLPGPAGEESA